MLALIFSGAFNACVSGCGSTPKMPALKTPRAEKQVRMNEPAVVLPWSCPGLRSLVHQHRVGPHKDRGCNGTKSAASQEHGCNQGRNRGVQRFGSSTHSS